MDNTVHQLKTAVETWLERMQFLQQLSRRLVEMNYDDTFQSTVIMTQHCLSEMQKLTADFPGKEPWGRGYSAALDDLRAVLSALEESLKGLARAKEVAAAAAADASWARVAERR